MLIDTTPGQLGEGESEDDYRGEPPPPEMIEAMSELPETDEQLAVGMPALFHWYLHRADVDKTIGLLDQTIYSRDAMVQGFVALASWSSVDRLATIAVPTLVTAGRHDLLTSAPQADRIADRIPQADRIVFEESGHMPWFDEPEAFFAAVNGWLDGLAGKYNR